MKFKPFSDWLLVKVDPPKKRSELIETVTPSRICTGVVLKAGPGRHFSDGVFQKMDVAPDERIAFFRENMVTKSGQQITKSLMDLGDNLALIRANDVLFVCSEDVSLEALCAL